MAEKSAAIAAPAKGGHSVKETLTSLIIAFVFAFVFRGFVIEAFVIPTGSMAPTLLGQHLRFTSPESGATFAVDAWDRAPNNGPPLPVQGSQRAVGASDPMTGATIGEELPAEMGRNRRLLSGDRIFVLKYLYSIFDPSRFDVVVFKYPGRAANDALAGQQENYIKRLVGLPGEEIAIVDGDVFYRTAPVASAGSMSRTDWTSADWQIARKGERAQRELWQTVYDSRYAPLEPDRNLRPWFTCPWVGARPDGSSDGSWSIRDRRSYTFEGSGATSLRWDSEEWPIDDRYAYNESPNFPTRGPLASTEQPRKVFPVSDVRLALGLEPGAEGVRASAVLEARGHEFRAEFDGDRVRLTMRSLAGEGGGETVELADEALGRPFRAGEITNIELWHVDQSLQAWVEGELVAEGTYAWSPALRVEHATGRPQDELLSGRVTGNPLAETGIYLQPRVRWEFEGGPLTVHRVRLERDIHYQPGEYRVENRHTRAGEPSLGTHPNQPCVLGRDHFFVCGDNSPNSADGRAWDTPDPWVYEDIDPQMGVVHRSLLIGKAFFVYFPSVHKDRRLPVPDVGRMRFIW